MQVYKEIWYVKFIPLRLRTWILDQFVMEQSVERVEILDASDSEMVNIIATLY